jgi:dTDP-4-dehydrorhamnose 3,5-epimerase
MQTTPKRTEQEEAHQFKPGEIRDVVVRGIRKFVDHRGWVAEFFRHDEMEAEYFPVMSYISSTEPGVQRGPHEHVEQADYFVFLGPSNFKIRLWDNRQDSETYNCVMTIEVGADNPAAVLVPKGVVHAYLNVGREPGIVINCPNRLYMGEGKREMIDEIRHEDDPATVYRMED